MSRILIAVAVLAVFAAMAPLSPSWSAQGYPSMPIDIIVPFPPGGGADIAARLYSAYLTKKWNVPINVVNKGGAGGIIGTHEALLARPDGYTMLCISHTLTVTGAFAKSLKLPFRWDDQTFISRVTVDPAVYIVRPDAPWKSLKELADFIRKNPKVVKVGGSGKTGIGYLAVMQFLVQNGIPIDSINYVGFTGGPKIIAAVAGSHIDFNASPLSEIFTMYEAKKLRALSIVWDKRLTVTPDVPTVAEAGYPKLDALGWHGMAGPAGLPEEVVTKWAKALEGMSKDPAFIKMAQAAMKFPGFLGPKEFREFLQNEYKQRVVLAELMGETK